MDVDEAGGLFDGYELKLNSYDLGVDIELADIAQRLRFEPTASTSRSSSTRWANRNWRRSSISSFATCASGWRRGI
jgi:hypothetical protein